MVDRARILFPLGQIVGTPGALTAIQESGQDATVFLNRHVHGDWGDVDDEDKQSNDESVKEGTRLLSAYTTTNGTKIWVITEADRSVTTLLLPEDY